MFREDFSSLKNKAREIIKIREDSHVDDVKGTVVRQVYSWELDEPVLIFNKIEQIEFNHHPLVITFKNNNSTLEEVEYVAKSIVEAIGPDTNNWEYLVGKNRLIRKITINCCGA